MGTHTPVVEVCTGYNTQDTPTNPPVLAGWLDARLRGPCIARVNRAAAVGGGVIKGVFLPSTNPKPDAAEDADQGRKIQGSDDLMTGTGRSYFYVDIPFVTAAAHNWFCIHHDVSAGTKVLLTLAASATTSAGEFFVETYDSGTKVKLTVGGSAAGGAVADNDTLWLFYVASATDLATWADGAIQFDTIPIGGADVLWYDPDNTATPSATTIHVEPQS